MVVFHYNTVLIRNLLFMCLFLFGVIAQEQQNKIDHCKKENSLSCQNGHNKCIETKDILSGPDEPSWFIIVPEGRLGNHLVGYSVIQALAAKLKIRPLITQETEDYLKKYFDVKHNISIYEKTFCNIHEVQRSKMKYFEGSIDEIVQDKRYHT